MKVAILGYGKQGKSAYEYWRSKANITICDQNESLHLPADVQKRLGPDHLKNLDEFDLLVRSPIVHPRDIAEANSPAILDKVTSATNEFLRVCPTQHVIGVTGTKGKGTTSTLIAKMLEAAGMRVHLGGNIGIAPLELLKNNIEPDDWVVLELANFQLIDLKYSPNIAVCLMVVPEHLNWHTDMDEYILAKAQLFEHQTSADIAIYFASSDTSRRVASYGRGFKIPYFAEPGAHIAHHAVTIAGQEICQVDELKLLGEHNWQNVCAAVTAVWQITQNTQAIHSVLTSFSGLEHRLEFVREVDGVRYYDDSFGTTPETAEVAIEAFSQPKIVILGGSDKDADFTHLAQTVASNDVRQIILIGRTAPRIQTALEAAKFTAFTPGGDTMQAIVQTARAAAQPGDIVLLSPACASFDMFQNYQDRATQFKAAVAALQE